MSLPKYVCIMLYVKLMSCSGLPCIYGQLEQGVSLSWNWYGVVVCHGSVVNKRRGWGQSVMKIMQCNGLPGIHVWLTGGSISVAVCHVSVVNWRGWGQSVMKIRQCNGLKDIHAQSGGISDSLSGHFIWKYELISDVHVHFILFTSSDNYRGVYLTPYLDTSCENMNSFPHFGFRSQCVLHLKLGWGVYLTAYLNTSSENMNSFPHFGFGSQSALHLKMGGISESEPFTWKFGSQCALHLKPGGYIWALHLTSWPSWTLHLKTWPNSAVCTCSSENMSSYLMSMCTSSCSLHLTTMGVGYIWIWTLHLKICISVCTSSETGGMYIWIWTLHLKIWVPGHLGVVITEVFSYYIWKTNEKPRYCHIMLIPLTTRWHIT